MRSIFTRRRPGLPRKGQTGGRNYDEHGYPIDGLPSDERPKYESDAPGFSLQGNDTAEAPSYGETTGRGDLFPQFSGGGKGRGKGGFSVENEDEPYDRPRSAPAPEPAENGADDAPQESAAGGAYDDDYDLDAGLSEYYDRLYNRLRAYGVTSIPTFAELYSMFESFLRPSIDAAIRQRNRRGRYNMAELDADAYARGMGGSSYLSSMKAREQHDIEDDVMELEGKYSASLAEYLYNALSTMQELEASLRKTAMQIAASNAAHASSGSHSSSSHSSSSHSSSHSSSEDEDEGPHYGHNKNGAYFDGVWYAGDFSHLSNPAGYYDYANYIEGLSAYERYLLFTSDQRLWRMRRWQMQYNLPQVDYEELYSTYFTQPAGGGGGGGGTWHQMTR